jgi:hypothetical protein
MIGVDELESEEIRKMFNFRVADPRIKQPNKGAPGLKILG